MVAEHIALAVGAGEAAAVEKTVAVCTGSRLTLAAWRICGALTSGPKFHAHSGVKSG